MMIMLCGLVWCGSNRGALRVSFVSSREMIFNMGVSGITQACKAVRVLRNRGTKPDRKPPAEDRGAPKEECSWTVLGGMQSTLGQGRKKDLWRQCREKAFLSLERRIFVQKEQLLRVQRREPPAQSNEKKKSCVVTEVWIN